MTNIQTIQKRYNKPYLLVGLLFFIPLSSPFAATFSHDFESVNINSVSDFRLENNGLSADFGGGTAFTIGNSALYRSGVSSWMIDPAGGSPRGTSSGTGTITLSTPAERITFYIRNASAQTVANATVLDVDGNVVNETSANSTTWTEVDITVIEGEALLDSVVVTNSGSTGMIALDDFEFTTPASEETPVEDEEEATPTGGFSGGGGGFLSVWWFGGFIGLFVLRVWRRYR